MTALKHKEVLVVGPSVPNIGKLQDRLVSLDAHVHAMACGEASDKTIEEVGIDLILLDHTSNEPVCVDFLNHLASAMLERAIPIFVLINDRHEDIQDVLSRGATDYILPNEDPDDVIKKIMAVFGQTDEFSGTAAIDITPGEVTITTSGIRVYVIEDDPLLRNLLSIRLDKSDFPYEFSTDGNAVLPAITQFKPDVIILDLMLPGKSGFEVLAEIKADKALKHIPVIVFSNRDSQEDRQQAEALGAVGFYVKAMTDLSELIETIESIVK